MKKLFTLFILCLSTFNSNGQKPEKKVKENYILTTEGKKIKIAPNEDIRYNRFSVDYYKKAGFYGKKKKVKGVGYISKSYKKTGSIKPERIVKIVDGDKLYLPFTDKSDKNKIKIFRYIAKNDKYILGDYTLQYSSTSPSGNMIGTYKWYYVFLDHDYNLIKKGIINGGDEQEINKNISEIRKKFGKCLDREDNLKDMILSEDIEPEKNLSIKDLSLSKKYGHYVRLRFLYYVNQFQCN